MLPHPTPVQSSAVPKMTQEHVSQSQVYFPLASFVISQIVLPICLLQLFLLFDLFFYIPLFISISNDSEKGILYEILYLRKLL